MNSRSSLLLISVVLLCFFGAQAAINLPGEFAAPAHIKGDLGETARIGGIVGASFGVVLWFGLAFAQWKARGGWDLGIGIIAVVTLAIQSLLLFIAIRSGGVPASASVLGHFAVMSVLPLLIEAITCFTLHATRDRAKS